MTLSDGFQVWTLGPKSSGDGPERSLEKFLPHSLGILDLDSHLPLGLCAPLASGDGLLVV